MVHSVGTDDTDDVPSPIDLRKMPDALAWEHAAMQRPWRMEFFKVFCKHLQILALQEQHSLHIIELGSGPGFLAAHLLQALPELRISLLDFSCAMHELAKQRLSEYADRITCIERDFKNPHWQKDLGIYDAVITLQAVHELRHKRYATAFHQQVCDLLKPDAPYLYCDHYFGEDGMNNEQLYMSQQEQQKSLCLAGFQVEDVFVKGGRALYRSIMLK